jgi:hypothetical protein
MSLPVLFHSTLVPALIQKRELPLAFGMLGVAEAALAVRRTSTEHPVELQVFWSVHICGEESLVHA